MPYRNPIDEFRRTTCWFHADYFYIAFPERFAAAQQRNHDVPNLSEKEKITLDISKTT